MLQPSFIASPAAVAPRRARRRRGAGEEQLTPSRGRQLKRRVRQVRCLGRPERRVVHQCEERHQALARFALLANRREQSRRLLWVDDNSPVHLFHGAVVPRPNRSKRVRIHELPLYGVLQCVVDDGSLALTRDRAAYRRCGTGVLDSSNTCAILVALRGRFPRSQSRRGTRCRRWLTTSHHHDGGLHRQRQARVPCVRVQRRAHSRPEQSQPLRWFPRRRVDLERRWLATRLPGVSPPISPRRRHLPKCRCIHRPVWPTARWRVDDGVLRLGPATLRSTSWRPPCDRSSACAAAERQTTGHAEGAILVPSCSVNPSSGEAP
jgi:hypothetical protein